VKKEQRQLVCHTREPKNKHFGHKTCHSGNEDNSQYKETCILRARGGG
jgi:hypothetical protein